MSDIEIIESVAEVEAETKFFSTTSFMKYILEKESNVDFIDLYFLPTQTFKNQFNNVSIKPLALLIKEKTSKAKSYKYNDMITYLQCVPIISFKPNTERKIYKKQLMQKLIIKNVLKEYQHNAYYESKIITVKDNFIIDKIKGEAPERSTFTTNDEAELFEA